MSKIQETIRKVAKTIGVTEYTMSSGGGYPSKFGTTGKSINFNLDAIEKCYEYSEQLKMKYPKIELFVEELAKMIFIQGESHEKYIEIKEWCTDSKPFIIMEHLNKVFQHAKKQREQAKKEKKMENVYVSYFNRFKQHLGTTNLFGEIRIYLEYIIKFYDTNREIREIFVTVEQFAEYVLCHELGHFVHKGLVGISHQLQVISANLPKLKSEKGILKNLHLYREKFLEGETMADQNAKKFTYSISPKQVADASQFFAKTEEDWNKWLESELERWKKHNQLDITEFDKMEKQIIDLLNDYHVPFEQKETTFEFDIDELNFYIFSNSNGKVKISVNTTKEKAFKLNNLKTFLKDRNNYQKSLKRVCC